MQQTYSLSNDIIRIAVKEAGAELCSIIQLHNHKEYIWDARPEIWEGSAPVLFPIVGALKNDTYRYRGSLYSMPRHGFIRNNKKIRLHSQTANSLTFRLHSDEETLMQYPFPFEFFITFTLDGNTIRVNHQVVNTGAEDMLFSLGAHPAFKCPLDENEPYSDYYIEFNQKETACTYEILPEGLIGNPAELILNDSSVIDLHYQLFNKGALVFKGLTSDKVSLVSRKSGKQVEMSFSGFPYFGIWAKPNADYVCLEPWMGIADSAGTDQNFETKEGIIKLASHSDFKAAYSLTVF
jgi:galactose mutarotase-like enzyme